MAAYWKGLGRGSSFEVGFMDNFIGNSSNNNESRIVLIIKTWWSGRAVVECCPW